MSRGCWVSVFSHFTDSLRISSTGINKAVCVLHLAQRAACKYSIVVKSHYAVDLKAYKKDNALLVKLIPLFQRSTFYDQASYKLHPLESDSYHLAQSLRYSICSRQLQRCSSAPLRLSEVSSPAPVTFILSSFKSDITHHVPWIAPLRSRQAGDFQCNLNRLLIVTDLNDLQKTLTTLSGEVWYVRGVCSARTGSEPDVATPPQTPPFRPFAPT